MRGFNSGEYVTHTQSRLKVPLFLLVLTGVLFLVYTNGLNTPFQSDDERHIIINPNINNTKPEIVEKAIEFTNNQQR